MKNFSQISDNKDIITKEYLVAGYEPLLPATPLEPGNKYLNGLRQWSTIPISISTTVTIAVADWNGGTTATVVAEYVSASNIVIVDPSDANVECTAQGDEELTFSAPATPTEAVTVKVVII